jgi:hypothetical protein
MKPAFKEPSRASGIVGVLALWLVACAPAAAPPPPPTPAPVASSKPSVEERRPLSEEPEPQSPDLRTGRIKPIEHGEPLALTVKRHAFDGDAQLLEVVLPDFAAEVPGDSFWGGTEVRLTGSSTPFQLINRGQGSETVLWLRRPKAEAGSELMGDAYTPALGARPGHHFRFRAPAPSVAVAPEFPGQWATALADYLTAQPGTFGVSAAHRLLARYKLNGSKLGRAVQHAPTNSSVELVQLMSTFSGRSAVQAAIAIHRPGVLSAAKQPRRIAIEQVKGPALARHPWADLSKRLGGKQPEEPLAKAVPADFYFVRAQSFGAFSEMLSFVESFGAPAADLLDQTASERGSLPRYLAELGVETNDLSRVLGPDVVHDFAITGSDPYVHEGSDVTLIFRLKSPLLFRAALLKSRTAHGSAHGGTQSSNFNHEGVTVDVARSADGRVRQHHAVVGELELVSNSPAAIKRVISTIQGKAPRLADEPDFKYMLARDADVPSQLLAFIGDRFVETVVGPAQKIAQARRQVALSELTAAPIAALLYGWIHGKSPVDHHQLLRSGLLAAGELKHHDGARIDWVPGTAPRSSWGTPATLEPLIDLPPVLKVSAAERDSYGHFAQTYQWQWAEYIDPIALRISNSRRGDGTNLHAELRVLPLVPAEAAMRFDLGGDGRLALPELVSGARLGIGIGKESQLRRGLAQALTLFAAQGQGIRLDWLGEYALVGVADRAELLLAAKDSREARDLPIERPAAAGELGRDSSPRDDMDLLAGLPVYAVIGLKSRMAAVVALTALRRTAEGSAPGAFTWAPFASHRGVEVVRITASERSKELSVYYAIAGDKLIVSLNRSVVRALIEQALDGKLPAQGAPPAALAKEGQVVLELAPLKKGPLRSLLGYTLLAASLEASYSAYSAAEAVLRGVPESAHKPERAAELSRAYFGAVPLTPDGRRFWLGADGIADPLRGTSHAPEWPALPVPDSAADRVLSSFGRLRSDLSFDEEPQITSEGPRLRSLRVRLDLSLR